MADKPEKHSDFAANDTFRLTVTTLSRIDRKYDDFVRYYKNIPGQFQHLYTQVIPEMTRNMKNVEKAQMDLWFWTRETIDSMERSEKIKEAIMQRAKIELERKKQEDTTQKDSGRK